VSNERTTDAAAALEASGEYRVLRKLPRRSEFRPPDGSATKLGLILDTETTGLNLATDEIIELAMIKFTFSADGRIFRNVDTFSALREPALPIPAEITALTGISSAMVAGQSIDGAAVARFVADAVVVIAHGAAFDRPFCEKLLPVFADKHWACSHTQIDWPARGHRGSKLTYLLNDFGLFYDGHRALDDCHALLEMLASVLPGAAGPPLGALLETARKPTVRIWATEAPYDMKEALKARGYRWSDGLSGAPKAWWTDVDEGQAEAELAWLRRDIYRRKDIDLPTRRYTSLQRFSSRV